MRRVLCVWFPNWTIQRLWQTDAHLRSAALVVSAEVPGRGLCVSACCPRASRQGVMLGMQLAEARAVLQPPANRSRTHWEESVWKQANPATDFQLLQRLALDCQRYTPLVGLDGEQNPESLLLDITGCPPLFGNEQGLLNTLTCDLTNRGFQIRASLADTIGAAWAMAHSGQSGTIIPFGGQKQSLESLPVAALRISAATVDTLDRLAIRTIGELMRLPRATLPSRFGPELIKRLHQALGIVWEFFTPERLTEPLSARWIADDPLTDQRQLSFVFRQLLEKLLIDLSRRKSGLLELRCELRTESDTVVLPLNLAQAADDSQHLIQLFDLACERRQWPGGVYSFCLVAVRVGCLHERQTTLLDSEHDSTERDVARLVERLSSRLGEEAVLCPVCVADPLPEFSLRLVPWLKSQTIGNNERSLPDQNVIASRPWRLILTPQAVEVMAAVPDGPPARLFWEGRTYGIAQSWGPERIETGWWRSRDTPRDYYRIETDQGHQFWLFRQRKTGRWYLHGLFD